MYLASDASSNVDSVIPFADSYSKFAAMEHEDEHKPGKAEPGDDLQRKRILFPDTVDCHRYDGQDFHHES